jgi:hypothetical protein
MTTAVVAGALANKPHNGGEAWVRLSWIRGLQELGVDTWFVEELALDDCRDADGEPVEPKDSVAAGWFRDIVDRFGLAGRSTLLVDGEAVCGPPVDDVLALAPEAALVNISGHLSPGPLFDAFRTRVLVDIDPGFTQIWHAMGLAGARVEGHDLFFTIGEHIGRPGCPIPTSGIDWRPIRQPVVLEDWPVVPPPEGPFRFTTVSSWRTPFGAVEWDGVTYPLKHHEFRRVLDLPHRNPDIAFELALAIYPAEEPDLAALAANGWQLVDPGSVAADPEAYRSFVQRSGGEFSVAQGVYVHTGSGWFSDRTVRYLATGRPVVVQDTGTATTLPHGEGLLTFRTPDEAHAALRCVAADPEGHRQAARAIAEHHFAAGRALASLVERI